MTTGDVITVARETIWVIAKTSLPILLISMIVGLVISLFQTLTSIQEQTLTFLPKLIVILLVIAFFSGAGFSHLGNFTKALFSQIPNLAK